MKEVVAQVSRAKSQQNSKDRSKKVGVVYTRPLPGKNWRSI